MTLAVPQKSCLQSCHVSVHLLMMASFVSRIETAVQTIHVLQVKIMRNRYGPPKIYYSVSNSLCIKLHS